MCTICCYIVFFFSFYISGNVYILQESVFLRADSIQESNNNKKNGKKPLKNMITYWANVSSSGAPISRTQRNAAKKKISSTWWLYTISDTIKSYWINLKKIIQLRRSSVLLKAIHIGRDFSSFFFFGSLFWGFFFLLSARCTCVRADSRGDNLKQTPQLLHNNYINI